MEKIIGVNNGNVVCVPVNDASRYRKWTKIEGDAVHAPENPQQLEVIVSDTGTINGRGSDKYKWVSGLSKTEREAVRAGEIVLIRDKNPHKTTTEYKQVTYVNKKYGHKNWYGDM